MIYSIYDNKLFLKILNLGNILDNYFIIGWVLQKSPLWNIILWISNQLYTIIMIITFTVCNAFAWIVEEVSMRRWLAAMVPSHCQSFAEGCRNGISRSSTILASLVAPLVVSHLEWWSMFFVIVTTIHLVLIILRRKNFYNIKILSGLNNK